MSIFRTTQKSVRLYSLLGLHHSAIYLISTLASFFQIKKPRFFLVELVRNGELRLKILIFGEKGLFQLVKTTEQNDNTLSQSCNSENFAIVTIFLLYCDIVMSIVPYHIYSIQLTAHLQSSQILGFAMSIVYNLLII